MTIKIKEKTPVENFSLLFNKLLPKFELEFVMEKYIFRNGKWKKCKTCPGYGETQTLSVYQYILYPEIVEGNSKTVFVPYVNGNKVDLKFKLLKEIVNFFNQNAKDSFYFSSSEGFLRLKEVDNYRESLETAGFKPLKLEAQTRLVMGMGIPSFFENGITLHHIYGIPYIPSSSVKGLLRFTYLAGVLDIFPVGVEGLPKSFEWKNEDLEPEEFFKVLTQLDELITNSKSFEDFKENLERKISKNDENNPVRFLKIEDSQRLENFYKTFVDLFGTLHQKGKVIYADALAEEFEVVVDIMNPHYKEYYQSSKNERQSVNAPYLIADIYTPTPIPFWL
jgi:CRISPR type III-B/RAMP module RAMP protein Cmr6